MKEIWKPIKGFEERYEVSNKGRIKSLNYNNTGEARLLKNSISNTGYYVVMLYRDGKAKRKFVHRLVAETYLPNPNNYPIINHKNENKLDNRVYNLEWCTYSYNLSYGTCIDRRVDKMFKKIAQYKYDGTLVRVWRSAADVNRFFNTNPSEIHKVCKGLREDYYGYIWKYAD